MNETNSKNRLGPTLFWVCLLLGVVTIGLWYYLSLPKTQTGKVVGGSMAPNFLGEHLSFQCSGCRSTVVCDRSQSEKRENLICPYCGERFKKQDAKLGSADLVTVEKGSLVASPVIARWSVIAFQSPVADEAGIKRVVGLPQEEIQIHGGDIIVDGKVLNKPIDIQRQMRILVHDTRHANPDVIHWGNSGSTQGEVAQAFDVKTGEFRFASQGLSPEAETLRWLEYQHRRYFSQALHQGLSPADPGLSPIEDNYGYNQSLSRSVSPMDDIFVEFEVDLASQGTVGWRYDCGRKFEFKIDLPAGVLVYRARPVKHLNIGSTTRIVKLHSVLEGQAACLVEFSTFDQQLVVLVNGKQVLQEPRQQSVEFKADFFAIGARPSNQNPLVVKRLRIWRDVYYVADPDEVTGDSKVALDATDGYLLFGDNSPISQDSRQWERSSLPGSGIIGIVRRNALKK